MTGGNVELHMSIIHISQSEMKMIPLVTAVCFLSILLDLLHLKEVLSVERQRSLLDKT